MPLEHYLRVPVTGCRRARFGVQVIPFDSYTILEAEMSSVPEVVLQKDQHRRVVAGHEWIYSNEIDNVRSPIKSFAAGDEVDFISQHGKWLARGYLNPHSLIAGRVVTRNRQHRLGVPLFRDRITDALAIRARLYAEPFYRLVYGESDGLPGVVVDRYGDVLVMQVGTAGMDRRIDELVAALVETLQPKSIVLRGDLSSRALEGLAEDVRLLHGTAVEHVLLQEGGCTFEVPILNGQKTGWFFDQADNRQRMQRHLRGGRVLDVFAYLGAWGLSAARAGATEVVCVDASGPALELLEANAGRNRLGNIRTQQGDAFEVMQRLIDAGEQFETVIVDPPAFVKRRKDLKAGAAAYERLNTLALRLVEPGGTLISASCSYHLPREALLNSVLRASRRAERSLRLMEQGGQAVDHPIHPAMPETEYLKSLILHAG